MRQLFTVSLSIRLILVLTFRHNNTVSVGAYDFDLSLRLRRTIISAAINKNDAPKLDQNTLATIEQESIAMAFD